MYFIQRLLHPFSKGRETSETREYSNDNNDRTSIPLIEVEQSFANKQRAKQQLIERLASTNTFSDRVSLWAHLLNETSTGAAGTDTSDHTIANNETGIPNFNITESVVDEPGYSFSGSENDEGTTFRLPTSTAVVYWDDEHKGSSNSEIDTSENADDSREDEYNGFDMRALYGEKGGDKPEGSEDEQDDFNLRSLDGLEEVDSSSDSEVENSRSNPEYQHAFNVPWDSDADSDSCIAFGPHLIANLQSDQECSSSSSSSVSLSSSATASAAASETESEDDEDSDKEKFGLSSHDELRMCGLFNSRGIDADAQEKSSDEENAYDEEEEGERECEGDEGEEGEEEEEFDDDVSYTSSDEEPFEEDAKISSLNRHHQPRASKHGGKIHNNRAQKPKHYKYDKETGLLMELVNEGRHKRFWYDDSHSVCDEYRGDRNGLLSSGLKRRKVQGSHYRFV